MAEFITDVPTTFVATTMEVTDLSVDGSTLALCTLGYADAAYPETDLEEQYDRNSKLPCKRGYWWRFPSCPGATTAAIEYARLYRTASTPMVPPN